MVRFLKLFLPVGILAVAGTFAFRGNWPWHRLQVVAPPIVVSHAFTESRDTLHQGETLSDLFARNGLGDPAIEFARVAALV